MNKPYFPQSNKLCINLRINLWITWGQYARPDLSTFDTQTTHGIWRRCQRAFVDAKLLSLGQKIGLSTDYAAPNNNINKDI